jgi:hypothetical protein
MVRGVEDLRTRIGEVLRVGLQGSHEDGFDTEEVLALADAVVRELGLRREVLPSGAVTDPVHGVTWFRQGGFRWVTEWVSDE